MKRYWPWIIGILVAICTIVAVTGEEHYTRRKYEAKRQEDCAALAVSLEERHSCAKEAQDRHDYVPWFHELLAWPNGITTWAIIFTGFVIAWQSNETRTAAKAALTQSEIAMNSQRAWIMGTLENIPEWSPSGQFLEFMDIAPIFRNYGETPGKIVSVLLRVQHLADDEQLPESPQYKGEIWESSAFYGEVDLMPKNMTVQPTSVRLVGATFINVKNSRLRQFVYWVVNYDDVHGRGWHTRSCYRYHIPGGFDPMREGYYIGGPDQYNRSGKDHYASQNPN